MSDEQRMRERMENALRLIDKQQRRIEALEQAAQEPIAIVGMSCRFPGSASTPDAYWRLLEGGVDAITEIPKDRWDVDAYFDPDPAAQGKMYTRHGAFLERLDQFDPKFFGISPREANSMDPQQRLLLEVSWEALEDAGLTPPALKGSNTGVFVGSMGNEYALNVALHDPARIDAYTATGGAGCFLAGRLSYQLGFQGPSLPVDTACSSSLVAVHLACESLRSRRCDLAVAGGVNVILAPEMTILICRLRALSPTGRCKTFDAAADGFVRGEGCGMVVLKRLSDALAANDEVLAVIRGSAVNHDGHGGGITVPNAQAQQLVIREALTRGGIDPRDVSYVEAHGTGTSLGDPIELRALWAVLGKGRSPEQVLTVGSVKTNVGHLEGAAGIAGLLKVVLSLRNESIPPHLHLQNLNPHIAREGFPIQIPRTGVHWKAGDKPRIAGVSSFGISGTNAHIVLADLPVREARVASTVQGAAPAKNAGPELPARPGHVLAFSARTGPALAETAARLAAWLEAHPQSDLADVCFSGNTRRTHFEERAALAVESLDQARQELQAFSKGERSAVASGQVSGVPKIAFLFTGQGSQYAGMARELYETQPEFRKTLDHANELLRGKLPRPLLEVLFAADGSIDQTGYTQPALFTIEVGLARLLRSFGVAPQVVLGHSVGEYAAACIAGVLSFEEGLALIAERGRLMQSLPTGGAMVAIQAEVARVEGTIASFPELSIAAENGANTVVSGPEQVLARLVSRLEAGGLKARRLETSHAFHSALLDPILPAFEEFARRFEPKPAELTLISNLTGRALTPEARLDASYWRRHAREPVRFARSIENLAALGVDVLVEIGPEPVLLGMARHVWPEGGTVPLYLPSLRRGRSDTLMLCEQLARLYARGLLPDFAAFDRPWPRCRVKLPTYPFQRQRYWLEVARTVRPQQSQPPSAESEAAAPVEGSAGEAPGTTPESAEGLYELLWRERPRKGQIVAADFVADPEQLAARVSQSITGLIAEHGAGFYPELMPELDGLAVSYACRAFAELGWKLVAGEEVTDPIARLGIDRKFERFVGRILSIFSEAGLVERRGNAWRVLRAPAVSDPEVHRAALSKRFPDAQVELSLLGRVGSQLTGGLRGTVDPLALLFPKDGSIGAEHVYGETPGARVVNRVLTQAITDAIAALPRGRTLRVLEIGAGTGGTTRHLLPALPADRIEYTYTDISAAFFSAAEARFSAYPFLTYRVLDIGRDPESQGFEPHRYDLVLAANALHAGPDLPASVGYARKLLAPGGLLVLMEGIRKQAWIDVSFGLLGSWWGFADELRVDHPLLTWEQWEPLLRSRDFAPVTALAHGIIGSNQAILLARTPTQGVSAKVREQPSRAGGWLLLADAGGFAARMGERLRGLGRTVVTLAPGSGPTGVEEALSAARAGDTPFEGVLAASGLDVAMPTGDSAAQSIVERSVNELLAIAEVLARKEVSPSSGLWVLTRGAQPAIPGTPLELGQAPLAGVAATVAIEHPRLRCRHVDLDPAGGAREEEGEQLLGEILEPDTEDEISLRLGTRLAARLVRRTSESSSSPAELAGEGAYLLTGPLDGLMLEVARWLSTRGARRIVVLDSKPPAAEIQRELDALGTAGCHVRVTVGRASEAGDLRRALDGLNTEGISLRGIISGEGLLEEPPIAGAWELHAQTVDRKPGLFVLLSNARSLMGLPGDKAMPAAASAFDAALAHHRHALGLPAVSVAFGPGRQGQGSFTASQAIAALERALGGSAAHVAIAPINWTGYARQFHGRTPVPRVAALVEEASRSRRASAGSGSDFLARLQEAPSHRREELLMACVQEEVAHVLRLPSGERPSPQQGFFDMGMDSLMAVEVRDRLQSRLGLAKPLSATALFDHPTIQSLVRHLTTLLAPPGEKPQPVKEERAARRSFASEPIAIVGLACRFPQAPDVDAFWKLLREGTEAVREVPRDRWDIDAYYDPDPDAPGKMYTRRGAFIDQVDRFDPQFFGIAPREAISMDPQQRLLLEVSWEALEHAAIPPNSLAGSRTGVFVGICNTDYRMLITSRQLQLDAYMGSGTSHSIAAGRVSYVLGLQGPSMAIDTACSSSLVAVHQARQSLLTGDCDLALAGGVNLMLVPEITIGECKSRMLSPDGRCKTFDAAADGFVRGEGCGVVVLKRLSDAQKDGDRVIAVIPGTAINQDGASSGLTVPNGTAQERLLRDALGAAGLKPREVSYIEAHGTGTSLGDPIEVRALAAVLARERTKDQPLLVGSVKTNIGHLETAAGIAGLIKVVLSLDHEEIPPHLHLKRPNPHIPWAEMALEVTTQQRAWPVARGQRVAGVSAFGFSGTNAHVLLADPPTPEAQPSEQPKAARAHHVLALSARTEQGLRELSRRFLGWLDTHDETRLADLCFTLGAGRAHFDYRAASPVESIAEARALLDALATGAGEGVRISHARSKPKVMFHFSGEDSAYPGMARELYAAEPVFKKELDRIAALLAPKLDRPLLEVLFGPGDAFVQAAHARWAVFAVELALAALLRSFGIQPDGVRGHGVGEHAAACVTGALSLEDGMRLVMEGEQSAQVPGAQEAEPEGAPGAEVWLEIGPSFLVSKTDSGALAPQGLPPVRVATLSRSVSDSRQLAEAVGALYVSGVTPDFSGLHKPSHPRKLRLPTYPFQRERYWLDSAQPAEKAKGELSPFFYKLAWRRKPLPDARMTERGHWLILADEGAIGSGLAAALEARGQAATVIHRRSMDIDSPSAFDKLLSEKGSFTHVVHLATLDVLATSTSESISRAEHSSLASVLHLVQALLRGAGALANGVEQGRRLPRVWLVTSGAQPVVGRDDPAVAQALLWGLGRVIALEHPELWGGIVDLPRDAEGSIAGALLNAIAAGDEEDQLALREGQRWVARFVTSAPPRLQREGTPQVLRRDASYLVTGGLGALGLRVARDLIERGAGHVVLTSRHEPSAEVHERLEALRSGGAKVSVLRADVSNRVEVTGLLAAIEASSQPLRGVVHAAGVLDDGVLFNQSRERFAKVLAPKVHGALHLHELTQQKPLDFFVLFSSASSVFGSPGQGPYAAANAFLDALAHHRRAHGLPALSINWGPWGESGMAAELLERDRQRWRALGVQPLSPDDALLAFNALLADEQPQASVLQVKFSAESVAASMGRIPPLLMELVGSQEPKGAVAEGTVLEQLARELPGQRKARLGEYVHRTVSRILKLDENRLDIHTGFFEFGLDSLMAVELRRQLQRDLGEACVLSSTVVLDHPTVARLTEYLSSLVLSASGGSEAVRAAARTDPGAEPSLDDLSADQLESLLDAELESDP